MKSEHILTSNFFKKNIGFFIYIFFLVLLIISWFLKPTKIETDIFSFFPKTEKNILKEGIYNIVFKKVSNKIIVLLSHNSQENSYNAAVSFYEQIKEKKFVKETQFYISKTTNEDFLSFYFPHKYHILSPETYNFLKEKKAKLLIEKTQRTIHSPFSTLGLSKIKEDPFLLSNAYLSSLSISDISLIPYKDILMSNFKERYYAFLSFVIPAEQASSPRELFSLMEKLKQIKKQTETQFKNSEVIITGIPVHTHDATKQSIKNINQIGIISIIGIFLLVYLVFNAFKPFFFSILSIGIGFIVAVCTTGFIFDKIHLLTLVFGTSLIGISIDYAFHFFSAHWQKNKPEHIKSNIALSRIFPGITLGLITSILGFGALIFPSFPILKQISIFTISGLIGAYLSVVLIFPKFYNPSLCKKKDFYLSVLKFFLMLFHKKVFVRAVIIIFLLMLVIGVSGIFFIKPSNNLQNFYTVSKKNFKNDQKVNTILQYQNSTQFFFILGKTSQEVLEKEELLLLQLNKLISNNTLGSYRATSQLIPSFKKQKENLSLIENNLMLPYLSQQALFLGFSEQETKVIEDDFNKIKQTYITIKPILYLKDLWLGKINQGYGSVVLLSSIKKTNPLRKLENEKKGIFFMNKNEDISNLLGEYQQLTLKLFILSSFFILLVLIYIYHLKKAFLIFMPPILSLIITFGVLGYLNIPINLFHVLALFLVLGIGIDYTIFYVEGEKHLLTTTLAITLSFFTTILSFGLLTFSGFTILSSFGVIILLGLIFTFILAPFTISLSKESFLKQIKN